MKNEKPEKIKETLVVFDDEREPLAEYARMLAEDDESKLALFAYQHGWVTSNYGSWSWDTQKADPQFINTVMKKNTTTFCNELSLLHNDTLYNNNIPNLHTDKKRRDKRIKLCDGIEL